MAQNARERRKSFARLAKLHHPDSIGSGSQLRFELLKASFERAEAYWARRDAPHRQEQEEKDEL